DYYDFLPEGWERTAERIPELVKPAEKRLHEAFEDWWSRHSKRLIELPESHAVMDARRELLDSFVAELEPFGLLDRYDLSGVVAAWWGEDKHDIETLSFHGFAGVVDGWLTTIRTAFELNDEEAEYWDAQRIANEQRKARGHRVVSSLIPTYLMELEEAASKYADINARYKAATAQRSDERRVGN